MKKIKLVIIIVGLWVFCFASVSQAALILFEDFEDSSGFTIGGGGAAYWGIAPLAGTASIPSNFIHGGSQDGNIFYGSFAKAYQGSPAATITTALPDLSGYTNLLLTTSFAAPESRWENTHRDSIHIIGGTTISPPLVECNAAGCMPVTDAIDSFLPYGRSSSIRSQIYSTDLMLTFQDYVYNIDNNLKSITFAFASTDGVEVVGIDSVRITGDPVAPVPEPATMLLFGTGILGVFLRRRLA